MSDSLKNWPAELSELNVSRETREELEAFQVELLRWNKKINLVSGKSSEHLWSRHILDSVQLLGFFEQRQGIRAMDIGSGGGFPGLVLAICLKRNNVSFTFVESDARKCTFLAHCVRAFDLDVTVARSRIEALERQEADILTARALAPLPDLLAFGHMHLKTGGRMIFPKGRTADDEIKSALETWSFTYQKHPSITDSDATILVIDGPPDKHG